MVATIGLFLLGTLLGSFYNVVGLRLPIGQSVITPPSSCTACGNRLKIRDLIPIWSWIVNRRKCRSCQAPISSIYPLGELATGIGFAVLPYVMGNLAELLYAYAFLSLMIIITISDLMYKRIPNKLVYPFMLATLAFRMFFHPLPWWDYALGFLIGGGLLLLVSIIGNMMGKPDAMGGGDIKLMALIGLAGGVQMVVLCLFISSLLGCITGLTLIRMRKLTSNAIAFGPFIAIGACISMAVHTTFFDWYTGLLWV